MPDEKKSVAPSNDACHRALAAYMHDHPEVTAEELARRLQFSGNTVREWLNDPAVKIHKRNRERLAGILGRYITHEIAEEPTPYGAAPRTIRNTEALRAVLAYAMAGADYIALARRAGMKPQTLTRLMEGHLGTWYPANLAALCQALHIDTDRLPVSPAEAQLLDASAALGPDVHPTRPVWVLSLAQAASIHDIREPLEHMNTWDCDTVPIVDTRDLRAVLLDGDSMIPRYHPGTIIVFDPADNRPENGETVVAKILDGPCVVKQYRRLGDTILLTSLNHTGDCRDFELPAADIEWLSPVLYSLRKERN